MKPQSIETIRWDLLQLMDKECSRRQVYRYLKALKIRAIGPRQRPALYPPDTSLRIMKHLFPHSVWSENVITELRKRGPGPCKQPKTSLIGHVRE